MIKAAFLEFLTVCNPFKTFSRRSNNVVVICCIAKVIQDEFFKKFHQSMQSEVNYVLKQSSLINEAAHVLDNKIWFLAHHYGIP
jgi:hypothetical protein